MVEDIWLYLIVYLNKELLYLYKTDNCPLENMFK